MFKALPIVFVCLLAIASCTKKKTTLTEPGFFTFTVDSSLYTGQTYDATYLVSDTIADYDFTAVLKAGTGGSTKSAGLSFSGTYFALPGYYAIGSTGAHGNILSTSYYLNNAIYAGATGWVQISRLDTVSNKISGTFEFTAVNIASPFDTVHITAGRMDTLVFAR